MPAWDPLEERSCDQLVMSAMETRMRHGVLRVKLLPSRSQMSSVVPGFRTEQQGSPAAKSTD